MTTNSKRLLAPNGPGGPAVAFGSQPQNWFGDGPLDAHRTT
jgi:hypothetical protein